MPQITIDIPTSAALRLAAVLEEEGFTGTSAEKLAEVKRRLISYLRRWVRGSEGDLVSSAAVNALTELDVPYD